MLRRGPLLFVLAPIVAVVMLAVLFLGLVGGYNLFQRSEQREAVEAAAGPVYLPGPELLPFTSFTAYAGWRNAFEITYAVGPFIRAEQVAVGYQLSDGSITTAGSEGPRQQDLDRLWAVHGRSDCSPVDVEPEILHCPGGEIDHLVRVVDAATGTKVIVAYFDNPTNGNPRVYNPESSEARLLRSLTPVPIGDALERHFNPIT